MKKFNAWIRWTWRRSIACLMEGAAWLHGTLKPPASVLRARLKASQAGAAYERVMLGRCETCPMVAKTPQAGRVQRLRQLEEQEASISGDLVVAESVNGRVARYGAKR